VSEFADDGFRNPRVTLDLMILDASLLSISPCALPGFASSAPRHASEQQPSGQIQSEPQRAPWYAAARAFMARYDQSRGLAHAAKADSTRGDGEPSNHSEDQFADKAYFIVELL
jgi:hypothetical protein